MVALWKADSSSHDPELLTERVTAQLFDRADIGDLATFALTTCGILGVPFRHKLPALAVPAAGRLFLQLMTAEWA